MGSHGRRLSRGRAACALALVVLLALPASSSAAITSLAMPPGALPDRIAASPDGALWMTFWGTSQVGRMTTSGQVRALPLAGSQVGASSLAFGPDGSLWVAEAAANTIIHMAAAGTVLGTVLIPGYSHQPYGVAVGPDGNAWVTEANEDTVARITPAGGVTEFRLPPVGNDPAGAADIVAGPDGAMWFTLLGAGRVGRIQVSDGSIALYPLPSGRFARPHSIVVGPDGALWFTESGADRIGRITTAGEVTEFPLPTRGAGPRGIDVGRDGNLWFVEADADKVGKITPGGRVTEFTLAAAGSVPNDIASGPDGALWFTLMNANAVGRITTDTPPAPPPAAASCATRRADPGAVRVSCRVRRLTGGARVTASLSRGRRVYASAARAVQGRSFGFVLHGRRGSLPHGRYRLSARVTKAGQATPIELVVRV